MSALRCAVILVVGIGLISCQDTPVLAPNPAESVTGVTVVPSSLSMLTGDKVSLTAMVLAGPGQSNLGVRWASSNAAVASVDANGVVSSLAGGVTTITATSLADSHFSGNCVVVVSPPPLGTVTIAGINDDGRPADLSNVSGIVDVIVNVDNQATTVLRVDALLSGEKGDTTVASYSPSNQTTQTSAGPTTLTFNTLGIINGAHVLRVRVALRNGTEVVSSSIQLTIKNP